MQYTIGYFSVSMELKAVVSIQYPGASKKLEPKNALKEIPEPKFQRRFFDSKHLVLPITDQGSSPGSWVLGTALDTATALAYDSGA
jgi:hypothetical protein